MLSGLKLRYNTMVHSHREIIYKLKTYKISIVCLRVLAGNCPYKIGRTIKIMQKILLFSTIILVSPIFSSESTMGAVFKIANNKPLPNIPLELDFSSLYYKEKKLSINQDIQSHLKNYIKDRKSPIAALVMVEVKTGKILAMVQGKSPKIWGGDSHTALYTAFPAASIFKNVVTAAALEYTAIRPHQQIGLRGVCGTVYPNGTWLLNTSSRSMRNMTLYKAYGRSCNGFFAKIAVKSTGLGFILNMAKKFGWNQEMIPADFEIPASPFFPPEVSSSSVQTVGKFAAGFGSVGLSALHAAWQTLTIANNGRPRSLKLFSDSSLEENQKELQLYSPDTAIQLKKIMKATVYGGTATSVFRSRRYRKIRPLVGGKTGTLSLKRPKGITSWFTGIMPLDNPKIVIASVVVYNNYWIFKAPKLAAEAFLAYKKYGTPRK